MTMIARSGAQWHSEQEDDTMLTLGNNNFLEHDDGGRELAGYSGARRDCVVRAISIATSRPYQIVYDEINSLAQSERIGKRKVGKSNAGNGTGVYKPTVRKYIAGLGWEWHPTMRIGQGCKVHLRADELPQGRLIVQVSKHLVAMIDGVIHDTHDPSRNGTRCVYGYWSEDQSGEMRE